MPGRKPELIYDGECGICREWVGRWRRLTGDRVRYRPYQEAAADYPGIAEEEFRRAIQFIDGDARRYSGAAAAFRVLSLAPGHGLAWWLYRHLPGFAWCSEGAYRFFARHRGLLRRVTHGVWGKSRTED